MDVRTKKLLAASFRGIVFYVDKEEIPEAGRKSVIHDFPNSNKRFVQDLGPVVPEYPFEAIIEGDNVQSLANAFRNALDQEGVGRLVLPNIGAVNVKALPYSVNYSHKEIGIVRFNVRFSVSNTDEVPGEGDASVEDVFQAGDEARLEIQDQFQEGYDIPVSRKDIQTASSDYNFSIVQTVDKFSDKILLENSRIQNIVLEVQSNLASLIRDPIQLARKLTYGTEALVDGLFATISALLTDIGLTDNDSPKTSPNTALELKTFGADFKDNGTSESASGVPLWPSDTASRQTRNNNRTLMVESVRLNSLVLAFELAANFDYQTSNEIAQVTLDLEQAYEDLILVGDPQAILANSESIKLLIDELKAKSYAVLEQKRQTAYSLTTLNFKGVNSVMNLTYRLYQERLAVPADLEELAELITNLNPQVNPLEMTGAIKGFET